MQLSDNIVELSPENFQTVLLEDSQIKPILVLCWAQAVEESVSQLVEVEGLMANYGPQLTLAKLDCQQHQQLAMQFQLQQLPTMLLFKQGQVVGGLAGVQSIEQVSAMLEEHLPKAEDLLLEQVQVLIAQEQFQQAYAPIKEAYDLSPERADIQKCLIDVLLNIGRVDEAEQLLANIMMIDQDDYYQALFAKLELKQQAADTPEIQALEAEIAERGNEPSLILQLAVQLHQVQRNDEALEKLFTVLKSDLSGEEGELKRIFMDILQALPAGDPLATQYRRKLYSLLY